MKKFEFLPKNANVQELKTLKVGQKFSFDSRKKHVFVFNGFITFDENYNYVSYILPNGQEMRTLDYKVLVYIC